MNNKTKKVLLALVVTTTVVLPTFANVTDITIKADISPILSVRLERTVSNEIVSADNDADPATFGYSANEILDFGTVSPLGTGISAGVTASANSGDTIGGTLNTAGNAGTLTPGTKSANGTAGTILAKTIDDVGVLYEPTDNGAQPGDTLHDGAIYTIEGALQLRTFKSGLGTTAVTAQATGGGLTAIIAPGAGALAQSLNTGATLNPANKFAQTVAPAALRGSPFVNDTAFPISVGIHVPFSKVGDLSTTNTIVTFTGT